MALYRELDTLHTDEELTAYRKRMEDRFGPMPKEGLDLMSVVVLRRLGRSLGIERILLKNGQMTLYFVSNRDSAFYQSPTFGRSIDYIKTNFKRCNLAEVNGKRRMIVSQVPSVNDAIKVLKEIAS
jgi:transcription-repair coupling factor (superfamily II helicase)